jgi:hypothetical protein
MAWLFFHFIAQNFPRAVYSVQFLLLGKPVCHGMKDMINTYKIFAGKVEIIWENYACVAK